GLNFFLISYTLLLPLDPSIRAVGDQVRGKSDVQGCKLGGQSRLLTIPLVWGFVLRRACVHMPDHEDDTMRRARSHCRSAGPALPPGGGTPIPPATPATSLLVTLVLVLAAPPLPRAEPVVCTAITPLPAVITVQGIYCFTGDLATGITSGIAI